MNKLNNISMIASRVLEVLMWVASALVILGLIASCIGVGYINNRIRQNDIDFAAIIDKAGDFAVDDPEFAEIFTQENYNIAVKLLKNDNILRADNTINVWVVVVSLVDGLFHCLAFAMIFRNIHLILKTAKGKTWFAQGETPFQKDITRMIREIGIFLIIIAVIDFVLSIFVSLAFNPVYIIIGVLMICLSSFFKYGEELQKDSDGLI